VDYPALAPSELFSVCASGGDSACWQEFIRRFNPVIARSVLRVAIRHRGSDKSLIDDLIQETYLKICANQCKLLRSFVPQHPDSAFAFLKVVAASVAQDHFKASFAEKRAPETTADILEDVCIPARQERPEGELNHTERAVLISQIDRTLKAVVPVTELQRARTVFWLYYRVGFTAKAIAALPSLNLTTKGVESLLFRLIRLVREDFSDSEERNQGRKKGIQQAESF
jgi:RNA polymerase sigma-70 factor (ECF subfamily)